VLAAVGILVALATNLTLGPALILWLRVPAAKGETATWPRLIGGELPLRWPRVTVAAAWALLALSLISLPLIHVQSNPLAFLPPTEETALAYAEVGRRLTGFYTMEVLLDPPAPWWEPTVAARLDALGRTLAASPIVARVVSPSTCCVSSTAGTTAATGLVPAALLGGSGQAVSGLDARVAPARGRPPPLAARCGFRRWSGRWTSTRSSAWSTHPRGADEVAGGLDEPSPARCCSGRARSAWCSRVSTLAWRADGVRHHLGRPAFVPVDARLDHAHVSARAVRAHGAARTPSTRHGDGGEHRPRPRGDNTVHQLEVFRDHRLAGARPRGGNATRPRSPGDHHHWLTACAGFFALCLSAFPPIRYSTLAGAALVVELTADLLGVPARLVLRREVG
jgi:hypothetical protein